MTHSFISFDPAVCRGSVVQFLVCHPQGVTRKLRPFALISGFGLTGRSGDGSLPKPISLIKELAVPAMKR
jgi:hypothetical protein